MAELTKATSTQDLLKDYDKGMNYYALSEKYGVPLETVREVVETEIPDASGSAAIMAEEALKI